MKCIRILIVLMAIICGQGVMFAQTHAEATSQKWKGIDVSTVIGNSAYPDDNTLESGFPFLLYNVGTGRFIMQGGDWAMEGRLFFSDFGRTMYLYSNGRINAAITESQNVTKNSFCARPPEPFGKNWSDNNYKTINLTTLMDGSNQSQYSMNWTFEPVVDPDNPEAFTYYMYQVWTKNNTKYYLGAAWGECHKNPPVGKGDGKFVYWDDDRSCWTTAEVMGNTNKLPLENGDEVEIQKLYQWRLISLDEFIEVLNTDGIGLNPSISSLIKDRDFTRNANDFYGNHDWTVSTLSGHTYENGTKRYTYTWGDYRKGQKKVFDNNQQSIKNRIVNEKWDSPVRLKEVFDAYVSSSNADDQAAGKKNAKFGFMTFEGVGTVTTNFVAPKPGWYEIECAGFSMSSEDHDAFLFARVIADNQVNTPESSFAIPTEEEPTYGVVTLGKLPYGTYTKESYESCLLAGQELLFNRDDHRQKVWVLISAEDFAANKKTIRLGFRKNEATKSALTGGGYYDTDWVCVDDIRASYMGIGPVFFYEDEEDLRYLSQADADAERFSKNEYAPAVKSGRYGGSANLLRKFTKDEEQKNYVWNTFSFPLPLTGEQVRNAFGDDCELLKLNSIGNLSSNDCIIDFETVNLVTLDNVVEAGNIYMLKPTKEPIYGETPRGTMAYYYDLGRMFFSTKGENEDPDYIYPKMNLSVWSGQQPVGSFEDKNDGKGYVTYTQTPGFESFRVNKTGIYKGTEALENSYAPKGSYAMSGGKMYELSRDTPIKGFRGWIKLTHSIFENAESSAAGAKIAINGVIDGDVPTAIDREAVVPVNPKSINAVYDLSGRKVGTSVEGLPKGLYIVGGKKLLVR